MKTKFNLSALLIGIALLTFSCQPSNNQPMNPNTHEVKVEEVINAASYTYLKVSEKGNSFWIAASIADVEKGKTYYYDNGLEMKNFPSKELKRTFETIYFVDDLRTTPLPEIASKHNTPIEKKEINIKPVEGGITIAELLSKRNSFSGKTVIISGQVVKFNNDIMKKNWIHIQDGTSDSNVYDLTVTTNAEVNMGDTVTFKGTIALKKDFGAGYIFDVIMEDATLQGK